MSSKQLSSLMRKAPPATVSETAAVAEPESRPVIVEQGAPPAPPAPKAAALDPDVPTQIKIPQSVRRQLDHMSIDKGEDLRVLVLRALRSIGVTVPDEYLKSRRGKRS